MVVRAGLILKASLLMSAEWITVLTKWVTGFQEQVSPEEPGRSRITFMI
jgi:hypothetical protein